MENGERKPDVGAEERTRKWAELRSASSSGAFHKPRPDDFAEKLRAWRRQRAEAKRHRPSPSEPTPPAMPPATNWIPIGPAVVRRGQASGRPPVSGRTSCLAIAPGGLRVYAATANGGVWRSDDGGSTWRSLMDAWDLDPTTLNVDSQACGAVAIDPANPDRVYVGTGEGEAASLFGGFYGVVFTYAGVGPLRSDNGGDTWINEPIASGSPSLNGHAFYELAVDPTDPERVVAATTGGLYRREPDGAGGHHWVQTHAGNCTSVVVSRSGGVTSYYAAMNGGPVLTSSDGAAPWNALGTGFPSGVQRVSLAVRPTDRTVVYSYSSAGVNRYDQGDDLWRAVSGAPSIGQSNYKSAIAVDPSDATRIYLGGTYMARGIVSSSGGGHALTFSMAVTSIGSDVHPDIHRLVVRTDATDEMWVATDGGVFRTAVAASSANPPFASRNVGLSTMTCTYLDHHPTEPAVLFCGAQDNGTLRYTGEEAWLHSDDGDGGAEVVNWNDPYRIIRSYIYGTLYRTTDGGVSPASWSPASPPASGALFYPPLVGTPHDPASPADADIIALGASRTWFSDQFGNSGSWSTPDVADLNGAVSSLVFASANRLYAGTTTRRVYLYTRSGGTWSAGTLIGQVGGAATSLAPIVTDIIIDPADSTGASFYVCLGGSGDWQRVWHYDGTNWAARSGPAAGSSSSLLAVHFNALAGDPVNPATVFAGADIGIWRSTDGGANWTPYSDGLPDAGVVDLQLSPTRRLLRAATYGRGVYERQIDAVSALGVELYIRDTNLDLGAWPTVDWLDDPEAQGSRVRHWKGPNIKVDPPSSSGTYQTPTTAIDFFQFVDQIVDGSDGTATVDASVGTAVNRVFVEVHNRGVTPANGVQVMVLLTDASAGLPPLPAGYAANVQSGTAINTTEWKTLGFRTIDDLRVGVPKVVELDLPSTLLPPPASLPGHSHFCVLALLHHSNDTFNNAQLGVDALSVGERKAAHKNLHVVEFTGTLPTSPSPIEPVIVSLGMHGAGHRTDLVLDLRRFAGRLTVLLPGKLAVEHAMEGNIEHALDEDIVGGQLVQSKEIEALEKRHAKAMEYSLQQSRFDAAWTRQGSKLAQGFRGVAGVRFVKPEKRSFVGIKGIPHFRDAAKLLLVLEAPENAKLGDSWEFDVMQVDEKRRTIVGGSTYRCRVALPPDDDREVQIEAHSSRSASGGARIAARVLVHGEPVRHPEKVKLAAVGFGAHGADPEPRALTWNDKRGAFFLEFEPSERHPAVRRITLVAHVDKLEGRRTIDVT